MATSDKLLQLIMDLQRDVTVQQGRRTLLDYARAGSGAHLTLLFILDKERQTLTLLERSGRRSPQRRNIASHSQSQHAFNPKHIPLFGLFGSALHRQDWFTIASPADDSRGLAEERYWIGRDERIILRAIGEEQAVLVLCFAPGRKTTFGGGEQLQLDEGKLLVCTILLPAYLARSDEKGDSQLQVTEAKSCEEQLQAAVDEERRRIAHDLHDGVAQQLAHIIHALEFVQLMLVKQPEVAQRELVRAADTLKESLQELRHGISSLLPMQLEEQGFEVALHAMLDEQDDATLKIEYDMDDMALAPLGLEVPIFRFLQEALNNVRKHAQASRVLIRVRIFAGLLVVEVIDNGRGFDMEQIMNRRYTDTRHHIGLRAMRDRIAQAGGSWELQSKPGEGTSVRARFLLTPHTSALTQRERDVLQLLVQGLTNRAIAERLSVSMETVKSHIQHIMQKMQVHDRTQAAVIATKQQWL